MGRQSGETVDIQLHQPDALCNPKISFLPQNIYVVSIAALWSRNLLSNYLHTTTPLGASLYSILLSLFLMSLSRFLWGTGLSSFTICLCRHFPTLRGQRLRIKTLSKLS